MEFNSRDVVASSPSFSRPAARAPREACSQASAEFIDPSTVFFLKVINEDNFTKICRHRRNERLNIGKRVKFESDASKASMTPPPLPQSTNVCRFLAKLGNLIISLGSLLSFVDGFSLTVEKKNDRGNVYLEDRSVNGPYLSIVAYSSRGALSGHSFPSLLS